MECGVISALFWQWLCFFLYSSRSSPSNIEYISHFFAKRLILPAASTNIHLQNVSSLNWYIWWFFGELEVIVLGTSPACALFCSALFPCIPLAWQISMASPWEGLGRQHVFVRLFSLHSNSVIKVVSANIVHFLSGLTYELLPALLMTQCCCWARCVFRPTWEPEAIQATAD